MVARQTRGSSTTHLRSKRHIAKGITDPGVGCSLDQFIKTMVFAQAVLNEETIFEQNMKYKTVRYLLKLKRIFL